LSRRKNRALAQVIDNTVNFSAYLEQQQRLNYQRRSVQLSPKTANQKHYVDLLLDEAVKIVFASGPAGTGKTMLAVQAGVKAFKEKLVSKLIFTRPAVGVDDEQHGFLPGTINQKMEPWTRPLFDVVHEYYSPRDVAKMLEDQIIEVSPLAFLRGRTFKNAWIVFDEAQNSSVNQMKMVLTRLGENSKMVITGDLNQNDKKFVTDNGLRDFIERLKFSGSSAIASIDFGSRDIQRHPIVREVLKMYGEG
jgi:phosphate starvation-inducible PhoH-like protein